MNRFSRFLISTASILGGSLLASAVTVSVLPGGLRQAVSASTDPSTETTLKVNGAINAADFDFIREMTALRTLDLSGATVAAYSGSKTETGLNAAKANTLPDCALMSGKFTTLSLPSGLTEIADGALGDCSAQTLVIPSTVTKIGNGAFAGMKNLKSVTLPSSVTSLGEMAFQGCPLLENVVVEAKLTTLPASTFRNCPKLSSVTLPSTVASIGEGAFAGCSSLSAITLPSSVTTIGNLAFAGSGLNAADLSGDALASIGDWAFARCAALKQLALNDHISQIGAGAFYNDPSLNVTLGEIAANLTEIPDYLLYGATSASADGLDATQVEAIGNHALSGMTSSKVTLPATLSRLGDNAMERWANLTEVDAKSISQVPALGESVWEDTPQATTILYVPQTLLQSYRDTPQWQEFDIRSETSSKNEILTEDSTAAIRAAFDGMLLMIEAPCDILAAQLYDISGRCLTISRNNPDTRLTLDTAPFDTRVFLLRLNLADGTTPVLKLLR